jgi:3' terminal RNA ribose 2'-O-methyltransferase Hen1
LQSHPERELIVKRYLRYQWRLSDEALARLIGDEETDPDAEQEKRTGEEEAIEKPIALNQLRLEAVMQAVTESGATRVIDLGCGEGKLLKELLKQREIQEIAGMDVSHRSLEIASERMHFDTMPPKQKERIRLFQGSLMYKDGRLAGFETATAIEVIEHLDPPRLAAFERVVFEHAKPITVIITTPNSEYNVRFETLPAGQFRHKDHRFEWTRQQFQSWAREVAQRFGYTVTFRPVGEVDTEVGSPTQMGVFSR